MIADLFRKDYQALTARGVAFEPEDIVRLNALAVKVTLSTHAADTVHLPRAAFVGKLALREPTIAHELWLEEASRWIDCRDDRNFLWLHGYALSREAGKLVDATKPKKLIRTVYRFAAKELSRFTTAQLTAAVEYALVGNDWKAGEAGGSSSSESEREKGIHPSSLETPTRNANPSPTIGLLVEAKARRLPLTVEEANRMTASELAEAVARARWYDGDFDAESAKNRAMGEYVRARGEITRRFKEKQPTK